MWYVGMNLDDRDDWDEIGGDRGGEGVRVQTVVVWMKNSTYSALN